MSSTMTRASSAGAALTKPKPKSTHPPLSMERTTSVSSIRLVGVGAGDDPREPPAPASLTPTALAFGFGPGPAVAPSRGGAGASSSSGASAAGASASASASATAGAGASAPQAQPLRRPPLPLVSPSRLGAADKGLVAPPPAPPAAAGMQPHAHAHSKTESMQPRKQYSREPRKYWDGTAWDRVQRSWLTVQMWIFLPLMEPFEQAIWLTVLTLLALLLAAALWQFPVYARFALARAQYYLTGAGVGVGAGTFGGLSTLGSVGAATHRVGSTIAAATASVARR